MSGKRLVDYMVDQELTQAAMSRKISRPRQAVWNWLQDDSTIELTEIGIRIRTKSGRIVHETQVAK